ncbi:hypothetical protein L798_06225 [Zootermopsis nevadensis]|uniref:Uncharacterized protein n=1 Tax=Zootermopsis nevadensis TaxID=136037 RepID=A0A067RJB9_ZOONE|nr:hypothetical protein L798_06225 [Zootermopsis nevadensis]
MTSRYDESLCETEGRLLNVVRLLTKLNATVTSRLPAGTAIIESWARGSQQR